SLLSVALSSFVVKHGYYSINTYLIGIAKTQIVLDKGYTLSVKYPFFFSIIFRNINKGFNSLKKELTEI
ncbi:MAG: hypothetical protein AAGU27_28725, partial [Dehalobacterium sp.]